MIIKAVSNLGDSEHDEYFNPLLAKPKNNTPKGIKMVCCCGYELLKESDDTFRCSGGNHRYKVNMGDVFYDKFGNLLFKKPIEDNKNGTKE